MGPVAARPPMRAAVPCDQKWWVQRARSRMIGIGMPIA